jgi:pyruvate dehydrogenase E1 component alpha subunit
MPLKDVGQFCVSYLQILDEDGAADTKLDPKLKREEVVGLYESMVLAREADQRMLRLQRQGRMGTFPLSTGQEAASCGAAYAMGEKDWLVSSYRELGARLARGEPLLNWMRYWNGYEEGNVRPPNTRYLPVPVIIGSQLPHAVGLAYGLRLQGESQTAVLAIIGDGGTSEGDFHEALNFAGVWRVPVVFLCQNNRWAISQPVAAQTASQTIAQKAIAYGFEGIQVDGNDALAVYRATHAALERAKQGQGPTLIEAVTYRLMMHTTADDPKRYRSDGEVEAAWAKDPIPRLRKYLVKKKFWEAKKEEALLARVREDIDQIVKQFEEETQVKIDLPFDHIFALPHPTIEAQRQELLADLARGE